MDRKARKTVTGAWRTLAICLVGVLIGTVIVTSAIGKRGGGGTLSGKTHVDVKLASISPTAPNPLVTTMKCPKGNVAVGGGVDFQDPTADVRVTSNGPTVGTSEGLIHAGPGLQPAARGWTVKVLDLSQTKGYSYNVGVVCANVK